MAEERTLGPVAPAPVPAGARWSGDWWTERVVGVCWVVAGALVVLVAAWVFRLGEDLQLTWVVFAGLHLLLLAAWPILALGLVLRRSALAATAIGLIAVQLVVAWPVLARDRSDGGRATITVSSLNVFVDNPDPVATARRIAIDPPDVLVLQEYTPEARDEFERSHLLEYYPHRIDQAEPGTTGEAIYSRFPLRLGRPADGTRDQLAVVTTLPDGQDLHIADVHVFGPQGDDKAFWYRSLRTLDRDLTALPEPWIAIGDYNATTDHRAYRDLLDGGRADAHVATGRGHARTWPAGKAVPPVFLIDHAIVSPGVEVTGTREQTLPGTDHRMIEVDLRVADE